jgi:drug/metabolite transporter (DMT)-like permease
MLARMIEPEKTESAAPGARTLTMGTLALVGFSVLMSVSAQLALRHGMVAHQARSGLALFRAAFESAWVLAGVAGYLLATVTWLKVLRRIDLVVAYPLGSLSFVFVTFFSAILLKEHVPLLRWLGISLILAGILVVARGERVASARPRAAENRGVPPS